jgi:hypothetical protein
MSRAVVAGLFLFAGIVTQSQNLSIGLGMAGSTAGSVTDANGNTYFVRTGSNVVRVIASGKGAIPTLPLVVSPVAEKIYPIAASSLTGPLALRLDGAGDVFVTDRSDNIQVIYGGGSIVNLPLDPHRGAVYSFSGSEGAISANESDRSSALSHVHPDIAVLGASGTPGTIQTVAGILSIEGSSNPIPGLATGIPASDPIGVASDAAGNLYYADYGNNAIRLVYAGGTPIPGILVTEGIPSPTAGWSYIIAGGNQACTPLLGACGDNLLASDANLNAPYGIAIDSSGNVIFTDSGSNTIRRVDANTAIITTIAGTLTVSGYTGDNGPATNATLNTPWGLSLDASNNIYFADVTNNVIRVVYQGGSIPTLPTSIVLGANDIGNIYTIAGSSSQSTYYGDGGPATAAGLSVPVSTAVDAAGNLYIADYYDNLVRMVKAADQTITTVAGTTAGAATGNNVCGASPCGDNGPATGAELQFPVDVKLDASGNLFIADQYDNTIRKVDAGTQVITAVAGQEFAPANLGGDGGLATKANLNLPAGIGFDSSNNLYLSDSGNNAVRVVYGTPVLKTQTITFSLPSNSYNYGAPVIPLGATSDSSAEPITYTLSGCTSCANLSGTSPNVTLTIMAATLSGQEVTVTANQAGDATHSAATPVSQSFTVNPASLTITASSTFQQPYGSPLPAQLPAGAYTATLVGTDAITAPAFTAPGYTITSPVGQQYSIIITPGSFSFVPPALASNYTTPTLMPGTLTVVGGGTQNITFPALPTSIVYGQNPIPLKATSSSGIPVTYTATGSAIVTGSAGAGWTLTITGAGQGTVTANTAGNTQYAPATAATQYFTVARATITVAPSSVQVPYGTAVSSLPLADTISAAIGSDQVTGTAALSATGYTPTSAVGSTYSITAAQSSLSISPATSVNNYTFVFNTGTLKVTQDSQTINFPVLPNSTYGSPITPQAASSIAGLPITYTTAGPINSHFVLTGLGTVTITASQPGNANVAAATPVTQSFTALPAVLTVQATSTTRAQGAPNPVFGYTITGFIFPDTDTPLVITGVPLLTTTATAASPAGNYPIVPSAGVPNVNPALGPLTATNYTFDFVNGTLTVLQRADLRYDGPQ